MGNNPGSASGGGARSGAGTPMSPTPLSVEQMKVVEQYQHQQMMNQLAMEDSFQGGEVRVGGRRSRSGTGDLGDMPSGLLPAVIRWDHGGKEIFISGSWDNWKGHYPLHRSQSQRAKSEGSWVHDHFYTIVHLPEGEHQYKYLVDGQWKHSHDEPSTPNDVGSFNNIVKVSKQDFEVFEALKVDAKSTRKKGGFEEEEEEGGSNDGYAQEIPARRDGARQAGPPMLPPHLLQVILNKETPVNVEPSLLPEPNHVMLNHLYALSIKDGVMVLSATHRYRKKYVTTLLYKPI